MCLCEQTNFKYCCPLHRPPCLTQLPKGPDTEEDWGIDEENWDEDNSGTYRPLEIVQNKNIIRLPPIGKSKSEKKKFRQEERIRLSRLRQSEIKNNQAKSTENMEDDISKSGEKSRKK